MTQSLNYEQLKSRLATEPHTWLITGVAGFIGSNLLETLLKLNQRVVGLDNFATGHQRNLDEVQSLVSAEQWANFNFINGDIRNLDDCKSAMTFSSSLRGDEVDAARHCEEHSDAAIQKHPSLRGDEVDAAIQNIGATQNTGSPRFARDDNGINHSAQMMPMTPPDRHCEKPLAASEARQEVDADRHCEEHSDAAIQKHSSLRGDEVDAAIQKHSSLRGDEVDAAIQRYSVEYVLHQAALGSVPRSVENPIATNETNIDGFLNMLVAARDAKVKRFVYAASSSTYGDHPDLPKVEDKIGKPLSPYAVTKYVNELYADVFARTYGFNTIGLRYFNVFGPRQDPNGAYAAVIPKWIASMIKGEPIYINGDGETSRDFCFIENVRQINLLAATSENPDATNQVYNVAVGDRTTLYQLYEQLHINLLPSYPHLQGAKPVYRDFRAGDVRHSLADISKAASRLGYRPTHHIGEGLKVAMEWYVQHLTQQGKV